MVQRFSERELIWLFVFFTVCMLGTLVILYSASLGQGNTLSAVLNPSTPTTTTFEATTVTTTQATVTTVTASVAGQGPLAGDQVATLSGYVKGRDGSVIANAYVFLHAGPIVYQTRAGANGYYEFAVASEVTPGTYQIRASTYYPEASGIMSELRAVTLQAGTNTYEIRYQNYPPITTITTTTTATTTTVPTTTPGTPMASIYVNVCEAYNYGLTGISWEKSGTNGQQWLPLQATGKLLSGNLSRPTRLNITQFESLGWPDDITLKLAGTDLSCIFNLALNARLEINMCTCAISNDPQYDY